MHDVPHEPPRRGSKTRGTAAAATDRKASSRLAAGRRTPRRGRLALVALALSLGLPAGAASASSLGGTNQLSIDFDGAPLTGFGSLSRNTLRSAAGMGATYLGSSGDLSIAGSGGERYLRQRYVPNSKGSPRVQAPVPLRSSDEMWLSYRVYFEPGWQWVKGGKLPGLAGGSLPSGGKGANGRDGFSARLMWRADGRLAVYAYHPDRPRSTGEDLPLEGRVDTGRWIQITQRVVMNSAPNRRDGIVEMWVDGQQRLSRRDIRWRTSGSFGIDSLFYSSFYGGNDRSWGPSGTTYARFDDFKVATSRSGVDL